VAVVGAFAVWADGAGGDNGTRFSPARRVIGRPEAGTKELQPDTTFHDRQCGQEAMTTPASRSVTDGGQLGEPVVARPSVVILVASTLGSLAVTLPVTLT
jgi:hypothetical protein